MFGWHHQFNGHELGQTPEDGERTGGPGASQSMGSQRVRHNLATEHKHTFTRYCGNNRGELNV